MGEPETRVYVEAGPFIDMAKHGAGIGPGDRESDVWYCRRLLKAATDGRLKVFTSMLSIAECTHVDGPNHLEFAKRFFMGLLASGKGGVTLVQPTLAIVEKARDLRWMHDISLSGADALHVASALHLRCDEFLTRDGRVLGQADKLSTLRLRVCPPCETSRLPSEYRQDSIPGLT